MPVVPTLSFDRGERVDLRRDRRRARLGRGRREAGGRAHRRAARCASRAPRFAEGTGPISKQCSRRRRCWCSPSFPAVLENGEMSFIYFDGPIQPRDPQGPEGRRLPISGRVRQRAITRATRPDAGEIGVADRAFAAVEGPAHSTRGSTRWPIPEGDLRLMELELVEPALYLNFGEGAAARFADAIAAKI